MAGDTKSDETDVTMAGARLSIGILPTLLCDTVGGHKPSIIATVPTAARCRWTFCISRAVQFESSRMSVAAATEWRQQSTEINHRRRDAQLNSTQVRADVHAESPVELLASYERRRQKTAFKTYSNSAVNLSRYLAILSFNL